MGWVRLIGYGVVRSRSRGSSRRSTPGWWPRAEGEVQENEWVDEVLSAEQSEEALSSHLGSNRSSVASLPSRP